MPGKAWGEIIHPFPNFNGCTVEVWSICLCSTPLALTMMTSSNGNIFRVPGHLCGEFTGHRWIPCTMASDAELWFFSYLCLNKRLSKQWWDWWFETPSRQLWRHCKGRSHTFAPLSVKQFRSKWAITSDESANSNIIQETKKTQQNRVHISWHTINSLAPGGSVIIFDLEFWNSCQF